MACGIIWFLIEINISSPVKESTFWCFSVNNFSHHQLSRLGLNGKGTSDTKKVLFTKKEYGFAIHSF